jgi:hypothetical protein
MFKIISKEETVPYKQLHILKEFLGYLEPFLKYKSFQKLDKAYFSCSNTFYRYTKEYTFIIRCLDCEFILHYAELPYVIIKEKTPQSVYDAVLEKIKRLEEYLNRSEPFALISEHQLMSKIEQYGSYEYTQERFDNCKAETIKEIERFLDKLKKWNGGELC